MDMALTGLMADNALALSSLDGIMLAAASVTPGAFDESLLNGIPATANPGTGTTKWGSINGTLCSGNQGKSYSSSTLTLTMTGDAMISFEYKVSSEAKYDKLYIEHNGETLVNAASGVIDWTALSIEAKTGDTVSFTYKKDSGGDENDDTVYLRNFSAGTPTVISFNANGGEGTMTDQSVYGTANLKANSFTKANAVFTGWATSANGDVVYTDGASITKPETNITLFAKWAEAYVVTFVNGDETVKTVNVKQGSPLGAANVPSVSKTGYTLSGWFSGATQLDPTANVTADVSYTAQWTANHYTIRFDANEGIGVMDDMTLAYDEEGTLPKASFVRVGYTFAGWSSGYADEDSVKNLSATDGATVTLKAQWAGNTVAVTVNPNYEGGTPTTRTGVVGKNYNYVYEDGKATYSYLSPPTREGYRFLGWFTAAEGGENILQSYYFTAEDAASGVTLYAHWVEAVTVHFDVGAGKWGPTDKTIDKGAKLGNVTSPTAPSGHAFDGWFTAATGGDKVTADTVVTESMTLYAQYHKYRYTIQFDPNGGAGTMDNMVCDSGTAYTLPACGFEREFYTFSHWASSTSSWATTYNAGATYTKTCYSDNNTVTLYAVWAETLFAKAFKTIETAFPSGNTVRTTGTLSLPESGTGWTASYTAISTTLMSGQTVNSLPTSGSVTVTLRASVKDTSTNQVEEKTYTLTLLSTEAVEAESSLKEAVSVLSGSFRPAYGTDTNICTYLENYLTEKDRTKYGDITVTVKEAASSSNGYASVAADGTISYYYNPGMTGDAAYLSVPIVLHKDGASAEQSISVRLSWDTARAKQTLEAELARISVPAEVSTEDLTSLPKYTIKDGVDAAEVDYSDYTKLNTWATVTWASSNTDHLTIGAAPSYPYYSPYAVMVTPTTEAVKVTLTATMTANSSYLNDVTATKSFDVTIKPVSEDPRETLRQALLAKLDAALEDPGLRDIVTGEALDTNNVVNDIRFPTTRDIGVDGKYQPVTITSSNTEVIAPPDVNNAARAEVFRPLPGKAAVEVTLTISITDKETGVVASRDIKVKVQPLTTSEINAELALMAKVKANYFNGIKNANTDPKNITSDLKPFTEAHLDSSGKLVFAYSYDSMTGSGIVPVAMDGWEVEESWRCFRSSDARVITHENLLVTRQTENRSITITSWLSSERFGEYAAKYPDYPGLSQLCNQPVSITLYVPGTNPSGGDGGGDSGDGYTEKKLTASFALRDNSSTWFSVSYSDLTNGTTVFDIFRRALADKGYSSEGGKFVSGISGAKGTLRNFDRGEYSGWMYSVNGALPSVLMNEYYIQNGDGIVFFFTDDYRGLMTNDSKESEDTITVEDVIRLIDAIGTVDRSSGTKITAARRAYDSLSMADKALVTNRSTLFAAEKAYAELLRGTSDKSEDIYRTTGKYILAMDEDELCAFGSEWYILALARGENGDKALYEKYYKAVEEYVEKNIGDGERLDQSRITENLRLILTLTALEKDVTDVAGHNLLTPIADMDFVEQQGMSGVVFALLALDGGDYEIPTAPDGKTQTTREGLVKYLLDAQLDDGGWAYSGDEADPDMTAMVLQALAPYYVEKPTTKDEKAIAEAVDKGIECLSKLQSSTGGYESFGTINAESAAQVIIALLSYGIDPATDSRFVKNGVSVLDALCSFYVEGGGFRHSEDGKRNALATAQGYCALTAYWRFTEDMTPFYRMTTQAATPAKAA